MLDGIEDIEVLDKCSSCNPVKHPTFEGSEVISVLDKSKNVNPANEHKLVDIGPKYFQIYKLQRLAAQMNTWQTIVCHR